jgi:hypothetical protein
LRERPISLLRPGTATLSIAQVGARPSLLMAISVTLLTATVVGCTSGDLSDSIGKQSSPTVVDGQGSVGPVTPTSLTDTEIDELADRETASPLQLVLGLPATPRERYELLVKNDQGYRAALSSCMRREGFDYQEEPTEYSLAEIVAASPSGVFSPNTDGYNVSTSLDVSIPMLLEAGLESSADSADASMSEEEQIAFGRAYEACGQEAFEISPTVIGADIPTELISELEQLAQEWSTSPEVAAVWDEWALCMSEQGYDFANQSEIVVALQERAGHVREAVVEAQKVTSEAEQELAELRRDEMTIASSDSACEDSTRLGKRVAEIRFRFESDWLEANSDRVALLLSEVQTPKE